MGVFNFFQEQILLEKKLQTKIWDKILVLICSRQNLEQANHSKLKTFFRSVSSLPVRLLQIQSEKNK